MFCFYEAKARETFDEERYHKDQGRVSHVYPSKSRGKYGEISSPVDSESTADWDNVIRNITDVRVSYVLQVVQGLRWLFPNTDH